MESKSVKGWNDGEEEGLKDLDMDEWLAGCVPKILQFFLVFPVIIALFLVFSWSQNHYFSGYLEEC